MVSRDISLVERGEIEDRMTKWIQEIERVLEDSMDHMEEVNLEEYEGAWDDVHGGRGSKPVWKLRRVEECLAVTGKPPIKMRWVDTNKSLMKGKYDVRRGAVGRLNFLRVAYHAW
eukprot:1357345-Karenia_brevis.AAC.1